MVEASCIAVNAALRAIFVEALVETLVEALVFVP
jgi:hypothetical protein